MSLKQVLVNVATPNTLATLQMYRDSMCEAVLPIRLIFGPWIRISFKLVGFRKKNAYPDSVSKIPFLYKINLKKCNKKENILHMK